MDESYEIRLARPGSHWRDALYWGFIAIQLYRLGRIVPVWMSGAPERYPWEYQGRLLDTITMVCIMGAVLLGKRSAAERRYGGAAYWVLIGAALIAVAVDIRWRP